MDNHKRMCKLLLKGDSYFNDENVDMKEINKNTKIKAYCHNNDCKTNEDRINALAAYIIMKFKESIRRAQKHNDYDEYLLMWISDKLLKMHLESIGKKDKPGYMDGTTLNEAYDNYLKNHKGILDYWDILNMQQGLKKANLKYMSEFYKLLNHICKIITYDETKGRKIKEFSRNSIGCSRQYKTLYMNISECKSYVDLLNKLKGIYDDFSSAIKKTGSNNDLKTKLQTLKTEDGKVMKAVRGFKTYDFSNEECKFPKKKKKKASPPEPQSAQDGGSSKTSQTGGSNSQNVPKTSENSKENTGGGNDNEGGQSDGNGNPGDGSSDPASSTPGGSFNLGSSLFKFLLNGAEKLNKTSQFIEKNRQTFKDAAEKINGAYNDIKDNLKNVYDESSNYFSEIINNLTEQFNQVNTPSKPGNSGNDIPQNSDQSKENGDTLPPQPKDTSQNPPNQLPSTPPSYSTPPSDSLKDTPKDSQPNSSPTTPIDPTPQNQPSSQLQPITQQTQQDDPSNHKKIDNTIVHLVKSQSPDPNLKKPCNIFSTTWNGSEDCKPKIKFMSTTLVCCTSKQCNITGISVTLFLMPIILLIVYKYLSSGWRNELKGKKKHEKGYKFVWCK
ncbi:hypothetical protein YYE_04405 [Plasmodium vinckei vinckei]|uniref:PIR protein CIR protein n=1 Tax=Plasmodium vinckei vinckei TaxID=54757 RepID=A0A081IA68_PLAVN|nr:hypothetical protein YYE_04405 [Plasmodium vinckei vinckei]